MFHVIFGVVGVSRARLYHVPIVQVMYYLSEKGVIFVNVTKAPVKRFMPWHLFCFWDLYAVYCPSE